MTRLVYYIQVFSTKLAQRKQFIHDLNIIWTRVFSTGCLATATVAVLLQQTRHRGLLSEIALGIIMNFPLTVFTKSAYGFYCRLVLFESVYIWKHIRYNCQLRCGRLLVGRMIASIVWFVCTEHGIRQAAYSLVQLNYNNLSYNVDHVPANTVSYQ